ncbi:hypothetical protein IFM89_023303 [Coptis chinensis]|uniref:Kinetochore protein NDC80 n=1 Tax=Coptis chinensis TaxID=261450 RepID=A0A835GYX7_9MAGN|nr:hypothetical protein IFM89_023303 [Coptis chinensis]
MSSNLSQFTTLVTFRDLLSRLNLKIKQETPSQYIVSSNRDSDASYGTNRPSSSLDQMSNVPPSTDITDIIRFLITQFDWPSNTGKLEEDLPSLLKFMMCPINLNKSALKALGTPHAWPSLLGVIIGLFKSRSTVIISGDDDFVVKLDAEIC